MHFYHFLHENKIEDIIKYPPNYIIIAKDYIPIELPKTRNEKIEGKPNYFENYKNIYMEVDASNYALETVRTFLLDLYERYPNKNPRLERKITQLQNILIEESKTVEEHYKQEGRAEEKYIKELTGEKPITSTILVDGENKDLLLFADKYIKANPILKDAYGILSIIMDDYRFKSYHELVIDKPRFVDQQNVTKTVFNTKSKILEINSKKYLKFNIIKNFYIDFDKIGERNIT